MAGAKLQAAPIFAHVELGLEIPSRTPLFLSSSNKLINGD
jgi:hypothetical protein